ncbi:MAG: transaldolase [Chloroflexi bacterium HGW-Chloroflexi-6]|nr:MAG: transaldolase [Chloroflexi bacterium HGW-Chloroflexi-6]
MSSPIQNLTLLGQSLWYDNIQRRLLESGELAAMIERGDIRGVTSNPTIFHNAISKTNDYDSALVPLALSGWDAESIFWQLAVEDIRAACDLFAPLYAETFGVDGYVSLEVSPYFANDTAKTIEQAKHLWQTVGRSNLMIKIPATKAGLPAIRQAIAAGINVNVTLIFSIERYREVIEAYLSGLEDCLLSGGDIEYVHSVASFFVSRLDSKIDPKLPANSPLLGKAAIANAKLAYEVFQETFNTERFGKLQLSKANFQRPLWASTGTKNQAYPDTLYVDSLIGPATVNTVPPQTLDAFREHGTAALTLPEGVDECRAQVAELEKLGISLKTVTDELEEEGVKSFADAFTALIDSLEARRKSVADQAAPILATIKDAVATLEAKSAARRMWEVDPTLWTTDPAGQAEIKIRLGWLKLPETSRTAIAEINAFAETVRAEGIQNILLIGMGGSSLGPEVFSLVFGANNFAILDSTDPGQVAATAVRFTPETTLYIVASKSGGTAEVMAGFDYFWSLSEQKFGAKAGSRFIAVTDPGTSLENLAKSRAFRKVFNADPMVGGRYSALTHFGLVPAALMGINLEKFLGSAEKMMKQCAADVPVARNPGLVLGAAMGGCTLAGRDKLTVLADQQLASVGSWLEQLIAESSGKLGKGIVVVDGEPRYEAASAAYGPDRLFVYLRFDGGLDTFVAELRAAGHPVLTFELSDPHDLGGEIYRWEVATAMACALLEVNPFDQPDVQIAKDIAKGKIAEFRANGKLSAGTFVSSETADFAATLTDFLSKTGPGDYVAINAYLPRNPQLDAMLQSLRAAVTKKTGLPTTLGFGPRFLHSTGQLHKGGADNGVFLQITSDPVADFDIPGQGLTFGTLERGQALGDYEALATRGRRILRIHLPKPEAVGALAGALAA